VAEIITAIAGLLWPLLILMGVLVFRRPLVRVLRSVERGDWTLEVGGQRLTVKQLSDQQNSIIADLQAQVGMLRGQVAELNTAGADAPRPEAPRPDDDGSLVSYGAHGDDGVPFAGDTVSNSVLWVDDNPANNALIVEQLQGNGVRVELAHSTQDGLAKLGHRRYGVVLSDMNRAEDGADVPDAGMRLLRAVRARYPTLPFLIYCSKTSSRAYRGLALAEGANEITASPTVIATQLRALGLL
jgi:CheY-like chemotaxis protein